MKLVSMFQALKYNWPSIKQAANMIELRKRSNCDVTSDTHKVLAALKEGYIVTEYCNITETESYPVELKEDGIVYNADGDISNSYLYRIYVPKWKNFQYKKN